MVVATVVVAMALVVIGSSGSVLLIGATLIFAGAAWTLAITATGVAAQTALPNWVRARGMGLWNLAITGGVAVGSALWGAVASWRLSGAYFIAAASLVVCLLLTLRWKLSSPDRLDVELASIDEPVITLTPAPTDGPVLVTVRYEVPDETYDDFLREMRRVERQRRRTGAYRWGLFKDLADPQIVLETFVVQSWGEHMRQHRRFTNTDLAVLGDARQHVVGGLEIGHYISCYSEGDGPPADGAPPTSTL